MDTATQANSGQNWSIAEAAVEVLKTAISGVTLGASDAAANPGSDATKAIAVQGVTNGKAIPVASADKQYAGVPSSFAIRTADGTVFTLAAGEIGFIQNLSADAPLAVKLGASASTTSLNFILKASTAASDGTGGATAINNWIGVVSVAKMTGTASYLAYKQAVT
jgi:hypothetical protein